MISCGKSIKIWPILNKNKIKEFENTLIKPLYYMKCEEIINKIEYILNKDKKINYDYLLSNSDNSIYLFKYMK